MKVDAFDEYDGEFAITIGAEGCAENTALTRLALNGRLKLTADSCVFLNKGENAQLYLSIPKRRKEQCFIDIK